MRTLCFLKVSGGNQACPMGQLILEDTFSCGDKAVVATSRTRRDDRVGRRRE